jgi:hypothetical protein
MKTPRPQTRRCNVRRCQRPDEESVRIEISHPATGDPAAVTLRFCPAHAPEVWDLRFMRESIIESLKEVTS